MEQPETTGTDEGPKLPVTSLASRLTNIFVAPGEVFDEVKSSPTTPANWMVPMGIAIIAGIIYTLVVFSQPAIIQGMRNAQEKNLQEQVAAGKMQQQNAEEVSARLDKVFTPTLMKAFGILGVLVVNPFMLFLVATVVWLLGRFVFRGELAYMQTVEAASLCGLVNALGAVVTMLLATIYGSMTATPSLALCVGPFDPANKVHLFLSSVNLFTFWYIALLALSVSRLAGTSFLKAAIWLFGLRYAVWAVLALGVPALMKMLKT